MITGGGGSQNDRASGHTRRLRRFERKPWKRYLAFGGMYNILCLVFPPASPLYPCGKKRAAMRREKRWPRREILRLVV